jgi:hypothetical protein
MAYINKEELRQLINQLKNDTDDVAILVGINRVGSGIDKLPTADVISAEAYNQVAWERDMAMQQIESYGVSFGSNAELAEVVRCKDCKEFEPHGNGKAGICRNKKLKPCLRYATDFCSYGERRDT